jgi:hypothetical protein
MRVILPSWIRIRIQPTKINADPYGSGSETDFGEIVKRCLDPVVLGLAADRWSEAGMVRGGLNRLRTSQT